MTAKEITDRVWATVDARDFDALEELLEPDMEFRGLGMEVNGAAAMRGFIEAYCEGFPDMRHEVHDYVERDGTIAIELSVTGTHTGILRAPQGDVPATGNTVVWQSADYIKVRDGKVASWHVYNDRLATLEQLGLVPATQPA